MPHVPLTELPTPVEHFPSLSKWAGAEVWIKRDDVTAVRYGGNKVRKLEYLLGEAFAREADTLITAGAAGSHHALATAIYGAQQGLKVHAVLMPQRRTGHVEEHLRALLMAGAEVHPVRHAATVVPTLGALAARQRLRGRTPFVIPPGGSTVAGVLGHVEAGLELARQLEAGVVPEPDAIFVALGTGGTTAGLAIGLAAAGVTTPIVAVRVVPRMMVSRSVVMRLVRKTVRAVRALDDRFPDVSHIVRSVLRIDHREIGDGYGEPTSSGANAERLLREHAGIELEPTYTAKTVASMLRRAREEYAGRRLLYIHTLSSADLGSFVRGAPPLPRSLSGLLR